MIPFSEYTFRTITFETDYAKCKGRNSIRGKSRKLLKSYGYKLDITKNGSDGEQEDWWRI